MSARILALRPLASPPPPARLAGAGFGRRAAMPLYTPGMACPACAGRNFWIGRHSAECARCGSPYVLGDR